MKGSINGIARWIIAACALMGFYIRLTLHNDYVIWKRWKADYEFGITCLPGLILGGVGQASLRLRNGGFLFF